MAINETIEKTCEKYYSDKTMPEFGATAMCALLEVTAAYVLAMGMDKRGARDLLQMATAQLTDLVEKHPFTTPTGFEREHPLKGYKSQQTGEA